VHRWLNCFYSCVILVSSSDLSSDPLTRFLPNRDLQGPSCNPIGWHTAMAALQHTGHTNVSFKQIQPHKFCLAEWHNRLESCQWQAAIMHS
jgi:hypothetical protein